MSKEVIEYFDKESDRYERIRWRGNFVSQYDFKVTREALTSLRDESELFLDMGCGPGTWLEELHRNHKTYVGIDGSYSMLRLCKKKHLPNVNMVLADCHKLPFRDHSFDTVMSSRVFIYLDLETALKEVKNVLKDSGSFILLIQVERRSIYFKLRNSLKRSDKFLENANYLTAHEVIAKVSRHLQITQTRGVIFHEHISQRALSIRPIVFFLKNFYLKLLYPIEKLTAFSFLKYFYASSIAIKAKKYEIIRC